MLAGTTQVNTLFVPRGTRVVVISHPLGLSDKWNCAWYTWLCSLSACNILFLNNTAPSYRRATSRPSEPWRVDFTADLPPLLAELDALMVAMASGRDRWPPTGVTGQFELSSPGLWPCRLTSRWTLLVVSGAGAGVHCHGSCDMPTSSHTLPPTCYLLQARAFTATRAARSTHGIAMRRGWRAWWRTR